MLRTIADGLFAAAFAPVCLSCAQVLESPTRSPVCERCWRNLRRYTPPWCATCGAPVARADAPHECLPEDGVVSVLRALGPYEGVLRDLLHALNREQGKTIVMVTHDPHAAARAKRTLYLDKGVLVKEALA